MSRDVEVGRSVIDVRTEDRFRNTAACLLLTPYIDENLEHYLPHPLRATVLTAVEPHRDHPCAALFRDLLAATGFGQFYCLASWLTSTPPFKWTGPPADMIEHFHLPPHLRQQWRELSITERWPQLLTSFSDDAGMGALWRELEPDWDRICRQCREGLDAHSVEDWMASFWGPPAKRMALVPNPTDPPGFGFGPTNRTDAFCLLGPPTVQKDTPEAEREAHFDYSRGETIADLTVHEFGHTFLASVHAQVVDVAEHTADTGASLHVRSWFRDSYPSWTTRLEEIILRAVQGVWRAECVSRGSADRFIQEEVDRFGLDVLPDVYQALLEARERNTRPGPAGAVEVAQAVLLGA